MKKRLLSMLLLVVMLVTSIPLVVFASAIEADTEKEPYNYNSLYVEENLIFAFDIMASNGFGAQALAAFPVSPMYTEAFDEFDEVYDTSAKYVILKADAKGNTAVYNVKGTGGVFASAEAAEAAKPADATDGSATYSVAGPYSYTILRANKTKTASGEYQYSQYVDALESIQNSVGYATEEEAEAALDTLKKADKNGAYEYFIIGMDTTAAYQAAGKKYTEEVNAWLAKYVWRTNGPTITMHSAASNHEYACKRRRDSMIVYAPFIDPADGYGYLTQQHVACTDWGLQINKLPQSDDSSLQMVAESTSAFSGSFVLLHNIGFETLASNIKKTAEALTAKINFAESYDLTDATTLSATIERFQSEYSTGRYFKTYVDEQFVTTKTLSFTVPTSLTFTLKGGLSENGTALNCDSYSVVTPDSTVFYANGIYTGTTNVKNDKGEVIGTKPYLNSTDILGYSNSMKDGNIYAVRYYDRALTEAEILQNHFADIAKWYQLDMSIYETLSAAQKADARRVIVDFVLGDAELSFSDKTFARDKIQDKLDTYSLDTIYGQLTDAPDEFIDVAKNVRADITGVLALPTEIEGVKVRDIIYEAVLALSADARKDYAMVQGVIEAKIKQIIDSYYSAYENKTDLTYKKIYVHQEHLVVWLDFFAAKATDGTMDDGYYYKADYVTFDPDVHKKTATLKFTLPKLVRDANGDPIYDGEIPKYVTNSNGTYATEYRYPVKGDQIKNWDLYGEDKTKSYDGAVNNMQDIYTNGKYIFKGANTTGKASQGGFMFYDLPDAGYGHDGIRTFGDGCLIGGTNNSLKVYSPGKDSDVTYQFVTNIKGNLQLDGYRANTTLNNGTFYIGDINYYGYGVATDGYTLSESALLTYKPTEKVAAGTVMDLTVTVDKTIGQDGGHYYTEVYQVNDEGAIKYQDTKLLKDLYRYNANGTNYLVEVKDGVYTAYYTVNAVGNKFCIQHDSKPVKTVQLTKNADGTFSVNWDTAVYGEVLEDTVLGAAAANVVGPFYKNPFPEVTSETPGATGPVVYRGTYDLGVYANGSEYVYLTGMPYTASDIGSVGNSGNLTTYAIRTYDIILTEAEIRQNHFADLAGFYGLDLAPYAILLKEAERTKDYTKINQLHNILASVQLGLSKSEGNRAYLEAIDAVFYNFDENLEGADNFLAICHAFGLNTAELNELSPEAQERVFAKFADVDAGAPNYTQILQKKLVDAVKEEKTQKYAFAYGHNTISFTGWQLHQVGDYGMRALFSTNLDWIDRLEDPEKGATVYTGLLLAEASDVASLDLLTQGVDENGELIVPEGATLVKGYWGGVYGENAELLDNELRFTKEVLLDLEDADEDEIAMALEDREFFYVGFSLVKDKNGDCTVFYSNATLGGKSDSFSVYDLSDIAKKEYKVTTKNIQNALNLVDGDDYITATVGGTALTNFKLVRTGESANLDLIQSTVEATLGVQFDMVRAADVAAGASGYVIMGAIDNLHDSKCYGLSTFGGNVYIWANVDADISDAVAIFTEYLDMQYAQGADAVFAEGIEIVCRAR